MHLPNGDVLLASAARYLIDGQEEDAASVLLACSLKLRGIGSEYHVSSDESFTVRDGDEVVVVELAGPRSAFDILANRKHPITRSIHRAVEAALPSNLVLQHISPCVELMDIDPRWREELLEIARGMGVQNQGVDIQGGRIITWKNLRFRSQSEVRLAQALERAGVLFLPNCLARLGLPQDRANKEADFLVCHNGRWGIIEVDGEPFHPPSRTTEDHERDRLFKSHGILVVEHFDAAECFENADRVVQKFLAILARA